MRPTRRRAPTPALALILAILSATAPPALAAAPKPSPAPASARPTRDEVCAAMEKATRFMLSISTEGGYLYHYSPDLSKRAGEKFASPTQIWIQPPGTPSMGRAFLNAHAATGNPLYLDAAQRAALALARCQLPSGGWHYSGNFDPKWPNKDGLRPQEAANADNSKAPDNPHYRIATTFDDNVTQSAVAFLMEYLEAAGISPAEIFAAPKNIADEKNRAIAASLKNALAGVLRAQYPNGAWPQRHDGKPRKASDHPAIAASYPKTYPREWPGFQNYTEYYTFNDGTIRDCIRLMLNAWKRYDKPEYLESARKGADFIVRAQMPAPQPGWAQQYNFKMQPAWARSGEPPGIASNETRVAIEALIDFHLETAGEKYLKPIGPAIDWLKRSAIKPDLWARTYEMKTNRPVYGKVDRHGGKVAYDLDYAPETYVWQSAYGIPQLIARWEKLKKLGRDAFLKDADKHRETAASTPPPAAKVRAILDQLDAQGRWLAKERFRKNLPPEPMISTNAYIKNMNMLSHCIKHTNSR